MNNNRRVIGATCAIHHGARGFTNLVVSRHDGGIVLDPHAVGACVISLDGPGALELFEALRDWFG